MSDTPSASSLAASVQQLISGYVPASVLFAAVELGVFDALTEPATVQELAVRTGASEDGVARLTTALLCLGYLARAPDGRLSAPPPVRAVLARGGPDSLRDVILHHAHHIAPLMARLADAVREGVPQYSAWRFAGSPPSASAYAELARHEREYATFLSAMDHASRGVGSSILRRVDLSSTRRLLEFGGGGGQIARELLASLPGLCIEGVELAPACAYARARAEEARLSARHTLREGSMFEPFSGPPADAVLLAGVLADWSAAERAAILRNSHRALRPGGLVLVSETLLKDDRSGPLQPAIFSLVMLAGMRGDQLTACELRGELARAGFEQVTVFRGGGVERDLVVATRPDTG